MARPYLAIYGHGCWQFSRDRPPSRAEHPSQIHVRPCSSSNAIACRIAGAPIHCWLESCWDEHCTCICLV